MNRTWDLSETSKKAVRLSTGKWIALCDQDDYWLPDKVEKMVRAIGDHPMVYCDSDPLRRGPAAAWERRSPTSSIFNPLMIAVSSASSPVCMAMRP